MNDTKRHILRITFALFLQKNFKEVTMKEIVEKTGLSKGAFYHYFESKEQLFGEVISYFFESLMSADAEREHAATFQEFYISAANQVNRINTDFLPDNQATHEIFNLNFFSLIFDALKLIPGFQQQMREYHDQERAQWTRMVARARQHGEISSTLSDERIAELFLFTADGLAMKGTLYGTISTLKNDLLETWDGIYGTIQT